MAEVSQLQFDFLMIKQYNDYIWVEYSKFTFPFIFILYLIKIFFPVDNSKAKQHSEIKKKWHDYAVVPLIMLAPFYYVIDGICLVLTGLAAQEDCKTDMLYHHIISAIFLPLVVFSRHIPSWQLGPGVFHAMLLTFPEYTWLNYPYLLIMIIFNYKLFSKPYTNFLHYKLLKYGVSVLYGCLAVLWLHSCSNSSEDLVSRVSSVYPSPNYYPFFSSIDEMGKVIFIKQK